MDAFPVMLAVAEGDAADLSTSVIIGNVRSVPTKMDQLMLLTRLQRDYPESSIIAVTQTWLMALTPDTDAYLDRAEGCAEGAEEDQRGEEQLQEEDGGPAATEKHQWSLEKPYNYLRAEETRLPGCRGSDIVFFFFVFFNSL